MRSNVSDVLPPAVKRSLTKFGGDLSTARRKRGLTALAVAERMGVAKNTYLRAEKGDPKVPSEMDAFVNTGRLCP